MYVLVDNMQRVESKQLLSQLSLVLLQIKVEFIFTLFNWLILFKGKFYTLICDLQVKSKRVCYWWTNIQFCSNTVIAKLSKNGAKLTKSIFFRLQPKTLHHEIWFLVDSPIDICIFILTFLEQMSPTIDFLVQDRDFELEVVELGSKYYDFEIKAMA